MNEFYVKINENQWKSIIFIKNLTKSGHFGQFPEFAEIPRNTSATHFAQPGSGPISGPFYTPCISLNYVSFGTEFVLMKDYNPVN